MTRSLLAAAAFTLAAVSPALAGPPTLTDLSVSRRGDDFVVSARLADGLTPERIEAIDAGIETVLDYRLQLMRRRAGLLDEEVAERRITCKVRHDALTRQYSLARRVDGEMAESRVTADAAEMRAFLTTLRDVSLAPVSVVAAGGEHYLRARCDLGLVWRYYLIPWRLNTGWARVAIEGPPAEPHDPRP